MNTYIHTYNQTYVPSLQTLYRLPPAPEADVYKGNPLISLRCRVHIDLYVYIHTIFAISMSYPAEVLRPVPTAVPPSASSRRCGRTLFTRTIPFST